MSPAKIKEIEDAIRKLNETYEEYSTSLKGSDHRNFLELKIQAEIVQFELCSQMREILENEPSTFARKVAIKGFIHTVYEYDKTLRGNLINRTTKLAYTRDMPELKKNLQAISRAWREALRSVNKFKDLRDKATGHYDSDISRQIDLIKSIDESCDFKVCENFLSFNMDYLCILRDIGRG
ncbi:MAG: hypothetical protein A2X99_03580 [Deltaproteobacteria bacterium GWB2_55_19]|nr:MAG: hypothetical protein A2X99_03580 [Deltaproteobacteria bacterium GWB2_55_19]HAO92442.1 hypothetical protein [Deltaproteobacteria bacterium]